MPAWPPRGLAPSAGGLCRGPQPARAVPIGSICAWCDQVRPPVLDHEPDRGLSVGWLVLRPRVESKVAAGGGAFILLGGAAVRVSRVAPRWAALPAWLLRQSWPSLARSAFRSRLRPRFARQLLPTGRRSTWNRSVAVADCRQLEGGIVGVRGSRKTVRLAGSETPETGEWQLDRDLYRSIGRCVSRSLGFA
jgi:hypothetical protein